MNNGKICVSVAAETAHEAITKIRRAELLADIIEVRFDYMSDEQIALFRSQIRNKRPETPLIATYRPASQGGTRELTLEERRAFWSQIVPNFWAADVEEDVFADAACWPFRIVSFHDLRGGMDNPTASFERSAAAPANAVKIAVQAGDAIDAIAVWKLIEKARPTDRKIVPIAMGDAGKWTRILGLAHGAFMTYASLEAGSETAGGQFSVDDLVNVYRVKQLDQATEVYGLIGEPVAGSLSPYIHNDAFAAAGINAVFIPLQVTNIDAFFQRMVFQSTREVELNLAGFAVTMPHKQAVMKYLDELEPQAERIGAVNTIALDNGKLCGHNTDADGFITSLKLAFNELRSARVAVLGAGGAARACVDALKREDANIGIFARDMNRAAGLAREFAVVVHPISDLRSEISSYDILVNATPIGMRRGPEAVSPLTADELKGVKLVFDLVTSAADTPLIREAKKAGVDTISGVEMLIEQAVSQFEIWTGLEAPRYTMRKAAFARMEKMR